MKILVYLYGFIALVLLGVSYYVLILIFGPNGIWVGTGLIFAFAIWHRFIFGRWP